MRGSWREEGANVALSTVIVAPTSTSAQPASFRPELTVGNSRTRVLIDQLTAVDSSRLGPSAGSLTWEELAEVDRAVQLVLGLTR